MGNGSSVSKPGSRLTVREVDRLQRRFARLADAQGRVEISQFLGMVELGSNPFTVRILQLFDSDKDSKLTSAEFQQAIEYFGTLNNPEEQYKFAFRIYDQDGDGLISGAELHSMLSTLITSYTPAQLEHVVGHTINQYDQQGKGGLNFEEFKQLLTTQDLQAKLVPAL